jgi:hypothetical protein
MIVEKRGTVWSYNPAKHVGTIIEDDTQNRYFFHPGTIKLGPAVIVIGHAVKFTTQTAAMLPPGRLPIAYDVVIQNTDAGVDALAEKADVKGAQ